MTFPAGAIARDNTCLVAIAMMCGAVFTFSLLDSASKYLITVASIPILQAMWVRFLSHVGFSFFVFGTISYFGQGVGTHTGLLELAAMPLRGRRPEVYRETKSQGASTTSIRIHGGPPDDGSVKR